ncbi:hypothetical protein [Lactovum odontotermitis]
MWVLHWIGSPQVELVNNGSDSLQIEKIYRKRHKMSKMQWLEFMQTELTPEKYAEITEIKDRVKLQGRPYHPELDEEYWKSRGY